jgi:hypothetical protein
MTAPDTELQRYPESASACLVRSMLLQKGIPATVHRVSRYAGMGGAGYVLRVDSGNLAKARALLQKKATKVDMDEYVDGDDNSYRRCPQCRSVMVVREPLSGAQRSMALWTFGVIFLFMRKSFRCEKCGERWTGR